MGAADVGAGAASGAASGATLGPWGAAGGAVLGAGLSTLGMMSSAREANEASETNARWNLAQRQAEFNETMKYNREQASINRGF